MVTKLNQIEVNLWPIHVDRSSLDRCRNCAVVKVSIVFKMSPTAESGSFMFMLLETMVRNGPKRMLDFMKTNKSTFIVNNSHFESTVAEATLTSSSIYESLLEDPSISTFETIQHHHLMKSNETNPSIHSFRRCAKSARHPR
jgi:hypothetical protein